MSLNGKNNEEKIWNYLLGKFENPYGVAGIMGNLNAESGLNPNNLQDTYERKLGYSDEEYVKAVDSGNYDNFIRDAAGFGLAQWTWWSRKQNLLNFAKKKGKSVGDLEIQLEFLVKELNDSYRSVVQTLKNAKNVLEASNAVLLQFERPADMSIKMQSIRANYGQQYYNKFVNNSSNNKNSNFKARTTKPEAGNKYYITKARGGYSDAIQGRPTDLDCDVLSNCVGFAVGRFNEIGNYGYCRYLRPVNAENFMQYANGLKTGFEPQVGACMVWQKGATLTGGDGAGHVAIVEKVINNNQIMTSESGWNSKPFWNQIRNKGNGNWGQNDSYKFLGFIYNPAVSDGFIPPSIEVDDLEFKRNLYVNCHGEDVKALQDKLISLGYSCGGSGADGYFGQNTKNAVMKFQKDNKLSIDGIAGRNTYEKLNNKDTKSKNVKVTANVLNVRTGPGLSYQIVTGVKKNSIHELIQTQDNWGKLKNPNGWVSLDYCEYV